MGQVDDRFMNNDEKLAEILAAVRRIETKLNERPAPQAAAPAKASSTTPHIADDAELDSQYGDPEVRKDPPRWKGASYVSRPFSECPADYLDMLASFRDWQADKDSEKGTEDGDKYAKYGRKDAARARGWAQRNRKQALEDRKAIARTTSAPADDTDDLVM